MIDWFTKVKTYYDEKLWNKAQVWDAVYMNKITPEQYSEITGEPHPEERPIV